MLRRHLIAHIHIAKKALGLDDEHYRQTLCRLTGKASCTLLSDVELETVLTHFRASGWRPAPSKNHRRYSPRSRDRNDHDEIDKLRALWIDMARRGVIDNGTEAALDAWVKRTTTRLNGGLGVERVVWLRGRHRGLAAKVLECLKRWRGRVLGEWQNADMRRIHLEQARTDQPQTDVVRQLLEAHAIHWWPLFAKLGIPDAAHYCKNRRNLCHD